VEALVVADTAVGLIAAGWDADQAVTALYGTHYHALVRLAALLVPDVPTAEEVVQDSFAAMHTAWLRLRDTDKALAYLHRSVMTRSRSVLRHQAGTGKNAPHLPPDAPSAGLGAMSGLERTAVVPALRKLPQRQREALALRFCTDLSEAQAASAMGISRGAVKTHTARGMSSLQAALEMEL
jgi:RNA polymerase sigma-70 factor (sigma-E family)